MTTMVGHTLEVLLSLATTGFHPMTKTFCVNLRGLP